MNDFYAETLLVLNVDSKLSDEAESGRESMGLGPKDLQDVEIKIKTGSYFAKSGDSYNSDQNVRLDFGRVYL